MKQFRLSDLAKRTGEVTHAATRAPVTITDRDRPRFVIMAMEDYEKVIRRVADPPRVFKISEMPEDLVELVRAGLDKNILEADREP